MSITVRTKHGTKYNVVGTSNGRLMVRQASGKARYLTVKDVGRERFDAAMYRWFKKLREGGDNA